MNDAGCQIPGMDQTIFGLQPAPGPFPESCALFSIFRGKESV